MPEIYAVHFIGADMRPQSGREEPWKVGETRTVKGKIELCARGYHYSPTWLAALVGGYLYGPMACIVRVNDDGPKDEHKGVCASRTLVEAYDVTKAMRAFAAGEAERALTDYEKRSGKKADPRSWAAVKATWGAANGTVTPDELSAAQSAAWSAARSAAWSAARSAESAARSAAWSAESAARSAAWSAARSAESAARSAAWSAESAAWSAAWSAARSAARSVAWSAESAAWSAAWSPSANRFAKAMGEATGWWDK